MDGQHWQRLNELFQSASALSGRERDAFLNEACGDDALLERVRQLLHAHDRAPADVATAALAGALLEPVAAGAESAVGRRFGPYRIVGEIGRGGMGVVYLAERADEQYVKRVAIKLIKQGVDTDAVLRMFTHERQILAALEHPNITRLLDAGTAEDGRPYFVMEYVEGTPFRDYCESRALPERERLELFRRVCAAVAHAHRHLIVHRDIKPRNILVTPEGEPKLLDFGIAKLMAGDGDSDTIVGARLLTPEYASPEQAAGGLVTTLSDVYSLGVVLHELIAGEPPSKDYRNARAPRGDLATIVEMALRTEPAGRYQSVEQLSDDIGRYLAGLPVVARRGARLYKLRKFVQRNAVASAAAVLLLVTLIGGIVSTRWQAVEAHNARNAAVRERDRALAAERTATIERDHAVAAEREATTERDHALKAETTATEERRRAEDQRNRAVAETKRADNEAATSNAVRDFLQEDLLAQASPNTQSRRDVSATPDLTVRAALDRAAERIGRRFESRPIVEAAIRQTIGVAYKDLGTYPEAQRQLERALDLRTHALGPRNVDTLTTMNDLGIVYAREGRSKDAEPLLVKAVDGFRALHGEDNRATLAALNTLATIANNQGRKLEVEALLKRVLDIQLRVIGEEDPDTLGVMNNLGTLYSDTGRYADSERQYSHVVEIKRRVLGEEHPSTLNSLNGLGVTYRFEGRYHEARATLERVIEIRRRVLGSEHPDTLHSINSLALVDAAEGKYGQAETLLLEALKGRRKLLGERHPTTLANLNNLAELYRRQNRHAEAETLFSQILDTRRAELGADHPNTIAAMSSLGEEQLLQAKHDAAEQMLRAAMNAYERTRSDTWRRFYTQSLLGHCLAQSGRLAEAEPLLAAGYDGMARRHDSIPVENRASIDDVSAWLTRARDEARRRQ